MIWYIISFIAISSAVILLILTRIRDRRYLRMKTSHAMRGEVWTEIEEEREVIIKRRDRFMSAMEEARSRKQEA